MNITHIKIPGTELTDDDKISAVRLAAKILHLPAHESVLLRHLHDLSDQKEKDSVTRHDQLLTGFQLFGMGAELIYSIRDRRPRYIGCHPLLSPAAKNLQGEDLELYRQITMPSNDLGRITKYLLQFRDNFFAHQGDRYDEAVTMLIGGAKTKPGLHLMFLGHRGTGMRGETFFHITQSCYIVNFSIFFGLAADTEEFDGMFGESLRFTGRLVSMAEQLARNVLLNSGVRFEAGP